MTDDEAWARIKRNAAAIRADGTPEFLNRWAAMTPNQLREQEERMAQKIGPREEQLRAFRNMRAEDTPLNLPKKKEVARAAANTAEAKAKAKPPARPAQPKETDMVVLKSNLKSSTASPTDTATVRGSDPSPELAAMTADAIGHAPENAPKSPAKPKKEKTVKTKTKKGAKSARRTPAKAKASRSSARPAKADGVRPGSKLEAIVGLLKRKQGCTTKDVLSATGWPSVSMPQQAKAAGLKLKKEKVEGVTRYSAA